MSDTEGEDLQSALLTLDDDDLLDFLLLWLIYENTLPHHTLDATIARYLALEAFCYDRNIQETGTKVVSIYVYIYIYVCACACT